MFGKFICSDHIVIEKRCTVKLTIDTASDSKDDIRRVIRFLQLFVSERGEFRPDTRAPEPSAEGAAALGQFLNNVEELSASEPVKDESVRPASFKLDFF